MLREEACAITCTVNLEEHKRAFYAGRDPIARQMDELSEAENLLKLARQHLSLDASHKEKRDWRIFACAAERKIHRLVHRGEWVWVAATILGLLALLIAAAKEYTIR